MPSESAERLSVRVESRPEVLTPVEYPRYCTADSAGLAVQEVSGGSVDGVSGLLR